MHKLLACIGLLGLMPVAGATVAYGTLPDNPVAFSNCNAKVKVLAARLRSGPSLTAEIIGVRLQDQPLYVNKVCGKWVQVVLESGDTAYVAAYLLSFPYAELLEQWKRETPAPSVGKKAKVKWASVNFRRYPSAEAARLGRFAHGDEVAVLSRQGAWSLVEARDASGSPCFGFVYDRALGPPDLPDPAEWSAPLARLQAVPGAEPASETPSEHLARTAFSPELFAAEWRGSPRSPPLPRGELLALR